MIIAIDALLLSILVRFAIEIRAYLLLRFQAISSFGNMAASLVCLVITSIAYADFKPVTQAWPDLSGFYLWTFFANRRRVPYWDRCPNLSGPGFDSCGDPASACASRPSKQHVEVEESAAAVAGR